jgi:hypothetical protein
MSRTSQHPAEISIEKLLIQCNVKQTRGSGPGGQHRNKVETAIVVEHRQYGVIGQASEKRSQERNREVAISRLRTNLAVQIRTPTPRETVSLLWRKRTESGKLRINPLHFDYAAILAEALDFVWQHNFEIPVAAQALGISSSQLIKFLKTNSTAFQALNSNRAGLGKAKIR